VHVWVECGADRFDDPSASRLVNLVEDSAEWTELREVAHELLLRKRAGDIEGLDVDVSPAALFQNTGDPSPVRELPRRIRLAGWDERQGSSARHGALCCS
jgi:hypothetical protein